MCNDMFQRCMQLKFAWDAGKHVGYVLAVGLLGMGNCDCRLACRAMLCNTPRHGVTKGVAARAVACRHGSRVVHVSTHAAVHVRQLISMASTLFGIGQAIRHPLRGKALPGRLPKSKYQNVNTESPNLSPSKKPQTRFSKFGKYGRRRWRTDV